VISIIVAIQKKDRGIGFRNELLFRISDDLKRFKALTSGHPIIMGRKTFDSIGKALPNRTNIVITRNSDFNIEGVVACASLEQALRKAHMVDSEIFIIGGGEIYNQAIMFADTLELTLVDSDFPTDTFFPKYSEFLKVVRSENHTDEKTNLLYEWVTLTK